MDGWIYPLRKLTQATWRTCERTLDAVLRAFFVHEYSVSFFSLFLCGLLSCIMLDRVCVVVHTYGD